MFSKFSKMLVYRYWVGYILLYICNIAFFFSIVIFNIFSWVYSLAGEGKLTLSRIDASEERIFEASKAAISKCRIYEFKKTTERERERERERATSLKKPWAESQIMHNQWRVTGGLIERQQKETIVIEEMEQQLHARRYTIFAVCLQASWLLTTTATTSARKYLERNTTEYRTPAI